MAQIDQKEKQLSEQLLTDLQSPESYPFPVEEVKVIQTHISFVALTSDWVYKIKKPVNLGFLDFSTLKKRRKQCEKEVKLNRRLCKNMYEGVVPISRKNGSLKIEEDSNIVDYAVKMRRLSENGFLNRQVREGNVDKKDIDRVVELLKEFYRSQEPAAEPAEWGRPENLMISIDENFQQTAGFQGDLLKESAFRAIQTFQKQFMYCQSDLLNQRRAEGCIVNGHGDLRLEHIHLTSPNINIFDCIEFNDRFRFIDIANDVAFLAMDLDYHNCSDLAAYFIRRMSKALADSDLPRMVDFYKSYRAYVRAKVQSLKSCEPEVSEEQKKKSRKAAVDLFRLALNYSLNGLKPMVLIIMGGIGTGKTTVAQGLADALGWEVFRSDCQRKQLAQVPLRKRPLPEEREKLYSPKMTKKTYTALKEKAIKRTHNGKSSLLDATYGSKGLRDDLRESLHSANIPYFFAELSVSEEKVKKRLQEREYTSNLISDARIEDFHQLKKMYESPDALEDARHFVVDSEQSLENTLYDILNGTIRLRN
ncbi:MAG: AAA family ATPase [bacterium]